MTRYDDFRVTGHIAPIWDDPWTVETFDVDRDGSLFNLLGGGGHVPPGTYTRLLRISDAYTGARREIGQGMLWMSDTPDEYRDHVHAILQARGRVLLNGLGLGCVLKAMLAKPEVEHVDVVERDGGLVQLMQKIAPWCRDERVTFHIADAFAQAKAWPPGTTWDVAWHDIWKDICADDLPEHAKLLRSYGRRVKWQGAWAHEKLRRHRRAGW